MYGIFSYIYHKNQPNVGIYTSPMDPMGSNLALTHPTFSRWKQDMVVSGVPLGPAKVHSSSKDVTHMISPTWIFNG